MPEKKLIATEDLFIDFTVPAFRKGDPVPAEHVERFGWKDLVATEGTKAAGEATTSGSTTVDPTK